MTPAGIIPADPIVRILPRVLIGIVSYYTYKLFKKNTKLGTVMAAVAGTATNSIGFLGLAVLFGYMPWPVAVGIMASQTIIEMVLAAIIIMILVRVLKKK